MVVSLLQVAENWLLVLGHLASVGFSAEYHDSRKFILDYAFHPTLPIIVRALLERYSKPDESMDMHNLAKMLGSTGVVEGWTDRLAQIDPMDVLRSVQHVISVDSSVWPVFLDPFAPLRSSLLDSKCCQSCGESTEISEESIVLPVIPRDSRFPTHQEADFPCRSCHQTTNHHQSVWVIRSCSRSL